MDTNPILILPFALLLGAMAIAPMAMPRWWGKYYAAVALGLGAITAGYYALVLKNWAGLVHTGHEYISFLALVGSLYVVAGGIHLETSRLATPISNVLFLLLGAMFANILGTTGAAMLLIRPWLRMNQARAAAYHVVFFIFIVANVGGCLTPIGDPPLFLGYLQGVPFWWVARNCWPMWLVGVGALLAIFYFLDRRHAGRLDGQFSAAQSGWKFGGLHNLVFLAIILGAVFVQRPLLLREGMMLAAAAGSYFTTRKAVHQANGFNFHPLNEVAVLFAGIFATMLPAMDWLNSHARELLGNEPSVGTFFWATGALSSSLDNAPTYLGFLNALFGLNGGNGNGDWLTSSRGHLLAISIGAVFFGAATYIGNGPNFMVKAVAEQCGVKMPGFSAYILRFALPCLLPMLILVWWLFFQG